MAVSPTKTAARHFYEKAKLDQKEGLFFPERYQARLKPKAILLKDYAEGWLKNQPLKGKKPSTIRAYRQRLLSRVLPAFGAVLIAAIERSQIKSWVATLSEEGLDYDTVLGYLLTLSAVLTEAVEDKLITVNPALRAGKIISRPKTLEEDELEIFTPEEEQKFLQAVKEHRPGFYPMALTFFRTGMRLGEVLGLHRGDVDFQSRLLYVRRNWTRGLLGTPKNGKARKIDMSNGLSATLKGWLELQDLEATAEGDSQGVFFVDNRSRSTLKSRNASA